jgi:hypothetical protein
LKLPLKFYPGTRPEAMDLQNKNEMLVNVSFKGKIINFKFFKGKYLQIMFRRHSGSHKPIKKGKEFKTLVNVLVKKKVQRYLLSKFHSGSHDLQ